MSKNFVVITGSGGLVGSDAALHFAERGFQVVGIDNDLRSYFFGREASTAWNRERLEAELGDFYTHLHLDIRDQPGLQKVFEELGERVKIVIHSAAQPSHDWAAREPITDFGTNALGTLNLLECVRGHSPAATFIFISTNKVYGDTVNRLPLVELPTRWDLDPSHEWIRGVPEEMSVDQTLHSLFGASKLAADVLVQEYGRYFGIKSVCFRAGCITGPSHSGAQLHGFLAYLVKCVATGTPYEIYGYKAKQVRDNIHSVDLVSAFERFHENPRPGEVYNIGGARFSNCSMLEAIEITEQVVGRKLEWTYNETNRIGDHIWWISDVSKFKDHYPEWDLTYDTHKIIEEIAAENRERWAIGK